MNRKKLNLILTIACACFAVVAIVLLVFGIIYDGDHTFTKVLMIVAAVLSLALAGELAYLLWFSGSGEKPNYFLYDASSKRNVTVDKLTMPVVNKRMERYFSNYAASEGKLWTDGILENPMLDMDDAFKPLVAYKLLFDLADKDIDKGWKCFELASYETVDFICRGLEMNGETEVAGNLRKMKMVKPFQIKYVRDYLVSNCNYLQTKMLMYVRDNIEKFQ
ncbi:MAG: hypothetical protein IJZ83_04625 [Clostridia bacterium]|nr:hypothetical protein [Clostridia bacterium]